MTDTTILTEGDVAQLSLPLQAVFDAVGSGLVAQADGAAISALTTSFKPMLDRDGSVAVVSGALPREGLAAVKMVGWFPGNNANDVPYNPSCLNLIDAETGAIRGIVAAGRLTTLRTAAVTALGAHALAPTEAKVLGCIGTRGIAFEAVRMLATLRPFDEIRLHSRNVPNTRAAASAIAAATGVTTVAASSWDTCLEGADIMIEGSGLSTDQPLFPEAVLKPATTLVVYGGHSSLPSDILHHLDRVFIDRWAEGGALGAQVATGELTEANMAGFIGDVLKGRTPARTTADERVLFWHRGVAACDIALAQLMLQHASEQGIGLRADFHAKN